MPGGGMKPSRSMPSAAGSMRKAPITPVLQTSQSLPELRAATPPGTASSSELVGLRPPSRYADFRISLNLWHKRRPGLQTAGSSALNSARSPNMLEGVTPDTEEQNLLLTKAFGKTEGSFFASKMGPTRSQKVTRTLEDVEAEFGKSSERIMSRIGELKRWHDNYEGRPSDVAVSTVQSKDTEEEKEVDTDKLLERLEVFKMHRRVEPELPPLTPYRAPGGKKEVSPAHILKRNQSEDQMATFKPLERERSRQVKIMYAHERQAQVKRQREDTLDGNTEQWRDNIMRKMRQGEHAIALQNTPNSVKAERQSAEQHCIETWMTTIVLSQSMNILKQKLDGLQGMSKEERALHASRVSKDSKAAQMNCFVALFKAKIDTMRKKKHSQIKYMQRWWRTCRMWLRDTRDKIARRWIALERAELTKELARKGFPIPSMTATAGKSSGGTPLASSSMSPLLASPSRKSIASSSVSFEDRLITMLDMTDEDTRSTFIEHELRARRYFALPSIKLFEDEVAAWRRHVTKLGKVDQAVHLAAEATQAISQVVIEDDTAVAEFHQPPKRPTYLPMPHPSAEAKGTPCPDFCSGRKGDEEILDMWKRCRSSGGTGYRTVPLRATKIIGGSGGFTGKVFLGARGRNEEERYQRQRSSGDAMAEDESQKQAPAGPFGEAGEEELLNWGVIPERMPGLAPREGPVQVEGTPL
eukprot:TRINITY_DN14995_c0_g1_i2.p1 TRINITY_DN14995_c0_g1~~TRINITY_DN14995_c0_g1_i2.p1  ORF type:complete len:698 (-),score=167.78 TRINITY_DN14995_c0_g1_i2:43-2136(-)